MRRIAVACLLLVLLVLAGGALPVWAADPVRLDLVEAYVVVLNDGRLNVRYTLTFTELEAGRTKITQMGPFPSSHTIVSASGEGPDGAFTVTLSGGTEYYQVNFEKSTRKGQQYKIGALYGGSLRL